jgi:hypothetical protein
LLKQRSCAVFYFSPGSDFGRVTKDFDGRFCGFYVGNDEHFHWLMAN